MGKARASNLAVETAVDATSSLVGAGVGLFFAGPPGAIAGSIFTPVLANLGKRLLSKQEIGRIEQAATIAKKRISENLKAGQSPRTDLNLDKLQELTEGTLLAARNAYEEKKIPLLANLLAKAPFTNTPVDNLNQTLITAERLSYRQLCIVAIVGMNEFEKRFPLSEKPFRDEPKKYLDEKSEGIYQDTYSLIVDGIIGQIASGVAGPMNASGMQFVVPSMLQILYPGRLLFNGLQLDFVDENDVRYVAEALK